MALSSRRETGCTFPLRDISSTPRGISNFKRCDEINGRTPLHVATSLKTGVKRGVKSVSAASKCEHGCLYRPSDG